MPRVPPSEDPAGDEELQEGLAAHDQPSPLRPGNGLTGLQVAAVEETFGEAAHDPPTLATSALLGSPAVDSNRESGAMVAPPTLVGLAEPLITHAMVPAPQWFDRGILICLRRPAAYVFVYLSLATPLYWNVPLSVRQLQTEDERAQGLVGVGVTIFSASVCYMFHSLRTEVMNEDGGALKSLAQQRCMIPARALVTLNRWRNLCVGWSICWTLVGFAVALQAPGLALWTTDVLDNILVGLWLAVTCCMGSAWLASLHLACCIAYTAAEEVRSSASQLGERGFAAAALTPHREGEWRRRVHGPSVVLATVTMPSLSAWGPSVGALIFGFAAFAMSQLPSAMERAYVTYFGGIIMELLVPVFIAAAPVSVGSSCDMLLNSLNAFRADGEPDTHARISLIETYFARANDGQGVGFKIYATVVNMRLLKQVATVCIGSVGSLFGIVSWIVNGTECNLDAKTRYLMAELLNETRAQKCTVTFDILQSGEIEWG